MVWFSLLVLIPLVAVLISAAGLGSAGFWDVVTELRRPRRPCG